MTTPLRLLGALFAIALVTAACGGSTTTSTDAAMSDDSHGDADHGDSHGDGHAVHAKTLDVSAGALVPAIDIALNETDTPGLFDLDVSLTNFTITPDNVDGDPVDNEGHMHLLIDGVKVERFMETSYQVMVPEGEHLVEVELNANNHAAYAVDGEPIRAGQTVTGHGEMAMADDGHGDSHSHGAATSGVEDGLTMADATVSRTATYAAGSVDLDGDERIEAAVGDVVMLMVNSDVAEQAHLHGYDVLIDVEPGTAAMFLFTADTPGKFEVEFEESGTFIAELVVS